MTTSKEFSIRPAGPDDAPLILRFIQGLADFEGLSQGVAATEDILRESLFGQNPAAEVALGFAGEHPAGFAVFYHNYSTFLGRRGMYLEDIFVMPEYRRNGLGKMLLTHVAAIAVERGCGRFEWAVLDWNQNAARFYHQLGAVALNDWHIFEWTARRCGNLSTTILPSGKKE